MEEEERMDMITNTNTNKLFEVIEGLHNNTVGAVRKLAMERNAMMRYMYIEGGLSTRYVPIQVSEQLPTPITNDNEDENFDYEIDGDDWNAQEKNRENQNDDLEETKVNDSHEDLNENEKTQNEENESEDDAKPAATKTTEEEIEAYQLGLEQPNSVIKLEKEKLG